MDPYVFGLPDQIRIICTDPDPDPCINKQKMFLKSLIYYFFYFFLTFLSLKNAVNVPSKSNKHNIFENNLFFIGILSATWKKKDPDPDLDPKVSGADPLIWIQCWGCGSGQIGNSFA